MMVNQLGEPVEEDVIDGYVYRFKDGVEIQEALVMLADKLGYEFVRTNATKHGNTQLQLRGK